MEVFKFKRKKILSKKELQRLFDNAKIQLKKRKRTIIILIVLIFAFVLTNPGTIPFISYNEKLEVYKLLENMFGDVSRVFQVININWITIFQLVVMILVVIVIQDLVDFFLGFIKSKKKRVKTFIDLYMNISKYLFTLVAILWGLKITGISANTIFAGISIVAMAVSFGAESLVADIVTGVFMLFDNIYNVDDIIEIDGYRGKVTKIGIRTTSIEDLGGNIQIINNSDVRNIINRSSIESKAICDIEVSNKYNLEKIDKAFVEASNNIKSKYVLIVEPKYKGIQSIGQDSFIVRIEAKVSEENLYDAQRYMNREIKIALQNNGIGNE